MNNIQYKTFTTHLAGRSEKKGEEITSREEKETTWHKRAQERKVHTAITFYRVYLMLLVDL